MEEDIPKILEHSQVCQQHPESAVTTYCETCKKALCAVCAGGHSLHVVFNISAMSGKIEEQLENAAGIKQRYTNILGTYEKLEGALNGMKDKMKAQVKEVLDFAIAQLQELLLEYTKPTEQLLEEVHKKKVKVEQLLESLDQVLTSKDKIHGEIKEALSKKEFAKIFQQQKLLSTAFITEAQLSQIEEKSHITQRKCETELRNDLDPSAIKQALQNIIFKLKEKE